MAWKKASDAVKYEFKKKGDRLEGKLIDVKPTQYDSKVYTIVEADGKVFYFFGCYKLDGMLPTLVGRFVEVVYKGKSKIGKGQTLRDYDISVWSDEEGKAPEGFDDDVPF